MPKTCTSIFRVLILPAAVFVASPIWPCESDPELERFTQNYTTMLTDTLANQETAAAEFLTLLLPTLKLSQNTTLQNTLRHAEMLAHDIRENQLPSQKQVKLHKRQLRALNKALRGTGCYEEGTADKTGTKSSITGRSLTVITMSLGAIAGFIFFTNPRALNLHRWTRKRMIRRKIDMMIEVIIEEDIGQETPKRIRGIDLTTGGIQLFWPMGAPKSNTRLTVHLLDLRKTATIAWSSAFNAGARFDEPLTNELVEELARRSAQEQKPA